MQQVVEQGLQHAHGAIATAKAHIGAADPGDHLLQELKSHPAIRSVIDKALQHANGLLDATGELQAAIQGGALQKAAAAAAEKKGAAGVAQAAGPAVDLGALRSATGKLRRHADISGLVDAIEKAFNEAGVADRLRSAAADQGGDLNLQAVRGALQHVDVSHVGVVSQIEGVADVLKQKSSEASSPQAEEAVRHVSSEVSAIVDQLRPQVARLVKVVDGLLAKSLG